MICSSTHGRPCRQNMRAGPSSIQWEETRNKYVWPKKQLSQQNRAIICEKMKQWLWTKIVTSVSGNGRHFNIIVKLFISIEKCWRRRQIVEILATMRQQVTYDHQSTKMQQDRRHVAHNSRFPFPVTEFCFLCTQTLITFNEETI